MPKHAKIVPISAGRLNSQSSFYLAAILLFLAGSTQLTAQDNHFTCPAFGGGELPIVWQIEYTAYIPFDHVTGPTTCSGAHGTTFMIYKGDPGANIGNGWPIQSERVFQMWSWNGSFANSSYSFPASRASKVVNAVGMTENYGIGSPANGSTLSSRDEDNVWHDCYLANNYGSASTTDMHGDLSVSGSTWENGNAHFYGTASNPLESSAAKIAWDMRVIADGSNPYKGIVKTVNFNHTCFPAHNIKAQTWTVYSYVPSRSDAPYIATCLVAQLGKIIGQSSPNEQVPCQ